MITKEEELEKSIDKYNKIEDRQPIIKSMVDTGVTSAATIAIAQLAGEMPILGNKLMETLLTVFVDEAGAVIGTAFDQYQSKKRNQLINKILEYKGSLTNEMIEKIDATQFIMEYLKTTDVVDRLAKDKKINFIGNLFGRYFLKEIHDDVDQYEEYLNQLSTLSYREIEILVELYKLESKYFEQTDNEEKQNDEIDMQDRSSYIDQLKEIAPGKWGISEAELPGFLTSLCTSGFVREMVGTYCGYKGGIFYTTENLKTFLSYILD